MDDKNQETPRATLKLKTKKGFSVLMTITSKMTVKEVGDLCDIIDAAEMEAGNHGYMVVEERGTKTASPAVPSRTPPPANLGVCKFCGSPNVFNPKTGKTFCSSKCWLKTEKTY